MLKVLRFASLAALLAIPFLSDAQTFKRVTPTPMPGSRLPLGGAATRQQPQQQQQQTDFWGRPKQPQPQQQTNAFGQQKKAVQLINRQEPLKVNQSVLKTATQDNTHIVVSIAKQRAYLMVGDQVAADGPISSGKRGHGTPTGSFTVMEKDPDHRSNIYGNFVDRQGRIIRAGVSAKIDSAPSGTHFEGAPMTWFLRLTGDGVGMHIGILPGYPASHGCVRQSPEGAKLFYTYAKVGTPVRVGE